MYRLLLSLTIFALLAAGPARAGEDYKLLVLAGYHVKWGAPVAGRGATVTYRFAFARSSAAGSENCRRTSGLDGLLSHNGLGREDLMRATAEAFALWSAAANVRFAPAPAGRDADITIAAEADPDGIAYSDVVRGPARQGRFAPIARAIVCLNPEAPWTTAPAGKYRLTYVLAHEVGHAIGLDHPGPAGTLMSFEYDPERSTLAPGDAAGARALYGTVLKMRLVRNVSVPDGRH